MEKDNNSLFFLFSHNNCVIFHITYRGVCFKGLLFKINYHKLINRLTHGASWPYITVPRRARNLALYYVVTTMCKGNYVKHVYIIDTCDFGILAT